MDGIVYGVANSLARLSNFHFSLYWQAGFRFLQLVQRQDSGLHVLFGQGSDITAYNHCFYPRANRFASLKSFSKQILLLFESK